MSLSTQQISNARQAEAMHRFYRRHAFWYDATRWTFLFGRDRALRKLKLDPFSEETVLEVGCGTGRNLRFLAQHFVQLHLIGVDVSPAMLKLAERATDAYDERVQLLQQAYAPGAFGLDRPVERILCSYSLSMFNPGWEAALDRAVEDLSADGRIVVVDFHRTRFRWFRWWMGKNHVRMDGHLLEGLRARFEEQTLEVRTAWFGVWEYFVFVGQKRGGRSNTQ